MKNFAAITMLTALPLAAFAHHGTNTQFNMADSVEVSGVITDLGFVNPHAYVYFDVTDENGNVENWNCEMPAASYMRRQGWTEEMFSAGTTIEVTGSPSRAEATGCYIRTIALGGGEVLNRRQQVADTAGSTAEVADEAKIAIRTAWGVPNIAGDWVSNLRNDPNRPENQNRGAGGPGGERPQGGREGGRPDAAAGRPPEGAEGQRMGPPGGERTAGGAREGGERRGGPQRIELSELGNEVLANTDTSVGVAGRLDCKPRDFFNDLVFDEHTNQIIQEEDRIILKYGFMDTLRTIYLNTREHPSDITPSFAGHSYGYWDGDVLVVDTKGFAPAKITRGPNVVGVLSEEFHTVERFSVDHEKGELTVEYSAEDPLYWAEGQTMTGSNTIYRSEHGWEPYNCDDRSVE